MEFHNLFNHMCLEGHQRGACSPSRIKFKIFLKIVEFKLQRKIKIKINKQTNKLACHEKDTKESKYEQIISHLLVKTHRKQYYRRR